MAVSYYPTGVKGGTKAGTDYLRDFKGKPAYKHWAKYIKNVALLVVGLYVTTLFFIYYGFHATNGYVTSIFWIT